MHAIHRRPLPLLLASQLVAMAAFATPITFDLTRIAPDPYADNVASAVFDQHGIRLTVTADHRGANVDWDEDGLGVQLNAFESDELDGRGRDESLFFSFDRSLQLLAATFSRLDGDDGFRVIGAGQVLDGDLHASSSPFDFTSHSLVDEVFQFTVADRFDSYKVTSITIAAQVPSPGTLGLLALGIPALQLVRRRLPAPSR